MLKEKVTLKLPEIPFDPLSELYGSPPKDSFAKKYSEVYEEVVKITNHIEWTGYDHDYHKTLESLCFGINEIHQKRRAELCQQLHDFLIEKNGEVICWSYPKVVSSEEIVGKSLSKEAKFSFEYFGEDYKPATHRDGESAVERKSDKLVFRNAYTYKKPRPSETECVDRIVAEFDEKNRTELIKAEEELKEAYNRVNVSLDKKKNRKSAFHSLILTIIAFIILGYIMKCGYDGRSGFMELAYRFDDWQSSLDLPFLLELLKTIVMIFLFIPILIIAIIFIFIPSLLVAGLMFLKAIHVGLYIVGAIVYALVLLYFINGIKEVEFKCIFLNPHLGEAKKQLKQCEKVKKDAQAEYNALLKKFQKTEVYKAALEEDRKKIADYEFDKKQNEEFALEWQKAWFDALIAKGYTTFG